jgi:hypothetical protein
MNAKYKEVTSTIMQLKRDIADEFDGEEIIHLRQTVN